MNLEYCDGITHTIKQGDTLYNISRMHKVPLAMILRANPYVDVYNLQVGDTICIPVKTNGQVGSGIGNTQCSGRPCNNDSLIMPRDDTGNNSGYDNGNYNNNYDNGSMGNGNGHNNNSYGSGGINTENGYNTMGGSDKYNNDRYNNRSNSDDENAGCCSNGSKKGLNVNGMDVSGSMSNFNINGSDIYDNSRYGNMNGDNMYESEESDIRNTTVQMPDNMHDSSWVKYVAQAGDTLQDILDRSAASIEMFWEKNTPERMYLLPGVAYYIMEDIN